MSNMYHFKYSDGTDQVINLDDVQTIKTRHYENKIGIDIRFKNDKELSFCSSDKDCMNNHIDNIKKYNKDIIPKENKMNDLAGDFKGFIKEHRSVLYWVAVLMLVDHFVFNGAFRSRLKGIVDGLVTKVEEKARGSL